MSKYHWSVSGQDVRNGIRADPRGFMGVYGLGVRAYVSSLGLTDEDIGLLRGWIVIS
jgi:hypothetical protein